MTQLSRRQLFQGFATLATIATSQHLTRMAASASPATTGAARRARLHGARNWVSYYQSPAPRDTQDRLARFDLVDIDADEGNFDSPEHARHVIGRLRERGCLVVSYLNIGAAERFRWYWDQAAPYKLDPYAGWAGEYWMDVREEGFRDLIVETVAPVLAQTGIDGFFLDNIDVAGRYEGMAFRAGVVELVRRLRQRFPRHLLVGQSYDMVPYFDRGVDGSRLVDYLDGSNKEEVNSSYQGGYHVIPHRRSDAMLTELARLSDDLRVMTLDYAITRGAAAYCIRRSTDRGLLPFVSVRELDRIRIWDVEPPETPEAPTLRWRADEQTVALTWGRVGDDMGVSRWDIYRDGRLLAVTSRRGFRDREVQPGRRVEYQVRAWDTGRHASALSPKAWIALP